jgi:hypothetical protein
VSIKKYCMGNGNYLVPATLVVVAIHYLRVIYQIAYSTNIYSFNARKFWNFLEMNSKYVITKHPIDILMFIFLCSPLIYMFYGVDFMNLKPSFLILFSICAVFFYIYYSFSRKYFIQRFPDSESVEYEHSYLIFPVEYYDYKNKNIQDDEPHLQVGDYLKLKVKQFPRDANEASSFEIYNENTPVNAALVCSIKNKSWVELIKKGQVKAMVNSIEEYGNLKIKMWIEK